MKSTDLSTLIDDIYSSLSPLAMGEDLNLSDDVIEEFGEKIKDAVRSWSSPRKQTSGLRMSNIGKPARQLWYESRDENVRSIPASVQIKFLYGHILEELVVLLVKLSGHSITDQQKEVVVDGIVGHIDCKIDGEVVDIKTASNFAFKKFKEGTLQDDDPFGYMAQLAGYEAAEGTSDGGFLAINKESGELSLYRPGPFSKPNIKARISNIRDYLNLDSPPPRCYADIPDGKSGNRRISTNCNYCPYKNECWSDANNGNGLIAYKYASGIKYFTRVVREPKVVRLEQ
mgnify:CR=1 FL=1|tara:strand:+ start:387 stop:1244 length:858 start_codon:yes stop_codon:yes gene_type:complete